jgi:hypothetical protein
VKRTLLLAAALLVSSWTSATAFADFFSIDPGSGAKFRPVLAARSSPGDAEAYVVAYEKNPGGASRDIYVRALDASGTVIGGGPVNISSVPPGYRASRPSIAFRSTSSGKASYMVAWQLDDEAGTAASIIAAAVLEVKPAGEIDVVSGGAFKVSFCGAEPAKDPDVAATTDTPFCGGALGDCIPYVVAYRCTQPNEFGTRSSATKVAAVHPVDFISTDTAIAFSQGAEDSEAMAPHVAFGDFDLSDRYVLTYRMLDGMGGAVVQGVEFDHLALSATAFYTEDEATGAPVVAFSKGADGGSGMWTIVRQVVAGSAALKGQHFDAGLGDVWPYWHFAPVGDGFFGYEVAGSPNTADFLLVYSQGNTKISPLVVYAVQIRDDASEGARYSAWVFELAVHQTRPSAAFQGFSATAAFAFVWEWGPVWESLPPLPSPGPPDPPTLPVRGPGVQGFHEMLY